MEDLERFGNMSDAIRAAVQAEVRSLLTTLPFIVSKSDQHTTSGHSAINGLIRLDDGTMQTIPLPEFQTMPVHFNGGGKMVRTHPVQANDEGIIVFAARALDTWLQSGGQQTPIDARTHHASDGFYIPGVKSDPNKLKHVSPDADHTRSLDGTVTHEVHPTTGVKSKVVDPTDPQAQIPNGDPFNLGTIFHQFTANPTTGLVHLAKDAVNTHSWSIERLSGILGSVVNTAMRHVLQLTPQNGFLAQATGVLSSITSLFSAHPVNGFLAQATSPGGNSSVTGTPQGNLGLSASQLISLAAPLISLPVGSVSGGGLANGSTPSSALQPNSGAGFPPAGQVGESYGQDNDHIGVVTNTDQIVASISLPAGLWMVWGTIWVEPDPATIITGITGTISGNGTTAGRLSDAVQYWDSQTYGAGLFQKRFVGMDIYPLSATTTTVSLVLSVGFHAGNCFGGGQIGSYRIL